MAGRLLCVVILGLVCQRVLCGFLHVPSTRTSAFPPVSFVVLKDHTRSVLTENLTYSTGTITAIDLDKDGFYDNFSSSIWNIRVQEGFRIKLKFVTMKMQADDKCDFDFLKIYDDKVLYGIFCGSYKPPVLTTAGNEVTAELSTDGIINHEGFNITYTAVEDSICVSVETSPVGSIRPPDGDGDGMYDNNMNCTWIIFRAEPSRRLLIQLYITDMDIIQDDPFVCKTDYLEIQIGEIPFLTTLCGSRQPEIFSRSERSITLRFQTDETITGKGFTAIYAIIDRDAECGGILLAGSGTIRSPDRDGDGNYDNALNCVWIMIALPGNMVEVSLHSFALNHGESEFCMSDRLAFYDGNLNNLMYTFCDTNRPVTKVLSKTRFLYMQFYSDDVGTDIGFNASYKNVSTFETTTDALGLEADSTAASLESSTVNLGNQTAFTPVSSEIGTVAPDAMFSFCSILAFIIHLELIAH